MHHTDLYKVLKIPRNIKVGFPNKLVITIRNRAYIRHIVLKSNPYNDILVYVHYHGSISYNYHVEDYTYNISKISNNLNNQCSVVENAISN